MGIFESAQKEPQIDIFTDLNSFSTSTLKKKKKKPMKIRSFFWFKLKKKENHKARQDNRQVDENVFHTETRVNQIQNERESVFSALQPTFPRFARMLTPSLSQYFRRDEKEDQKSTIESLSYWECVTDSTVSHPQSTASSIFESKSSILSVTHCEIQVFVQNLDFPFVVVIDECTTSALLIFDIWSRGVLKAQRQDWDLFAIEGKAGGERGGFIVIDEFQLTANEFLYDVVTRTGVGKKLKFMLKRKDQFHSAKLDELSIRRMNTVREKSHVSERSLMKRKSGNLRLQSERRFKLLDKATINLDYAVADFGNLTCLISYLSPDTTIQNLLFDCQSQLASQLLPITQRIDGKWVILRWDKQKYRFIRCENGENAFQLISNLDHDQTLLLTIHRVDIEP